MTICGDASAEEFTEFYLDDEWRLRWEDYLVMSEVLEAGDPEQREQVLTTGGCHVQLLHWDFVA